MNYWYSLRALLCDDLLGMVFLPDSEVERDRCAYNRGKRFSDALAELEK